MRSRSVLVRLVALTLGLMLPVHPASTGGREAENPVCPPIAGIIEGPDPIPSRCLEDLIDAAEDSDAARSADGGQIVAWAEPAGTDHDIALCEWTADGWEATRYLTSTPADEREPDLFLDRDGSLYLAWTRYGETSQVVYTRRDPRSGFWSADVVVADNARRPVIISRDGRAVLVFERLQGGRRELVVALPRIDGDFDLRVVERTRGVEFLAPVLRVDADGLWIAWRQENRGYFVRSVDAEGRLGATAFVPAGLASSTGSALRRIRDRTRNPTGCRD